MVHKAVGSNLGLGQFTTEKLFQIREGSGGEKRGMGSAFHMLCLSYSDPLAPLPLRPLSCGIPLRLIELSYWRVTP